MRECSSLRAGGEAIRAFEVAYFAATADGEATVRRFARSLDADFPILADPAGAVARAYGVVGVLGLPRRWTFYVGADGRVLHVDREVRPATAGADIAATLARLGVAGRSAPP